MNNHDEISDRILEIVSSASNQRIRPSVLNKVLREEFGLPLKEIKELLNDLVEENVLVFTYRDPCSYLEIPVVESHRPARPMKVIRDLQGDLWICDTEADPSKDPAEQGCWSCGELPFTRND